MLAHVAFLRKGTLAHSTAVWLEANMYGAVMLGSGSGLTESLAALLARKRAELCMNSRLMLLQVTDALEAVLAEGACMCTG